MVYVQSTFVTITGDVKSHVTHPPAVSLVSKWSSVFCQSSIISPVPAAVSGTGPLPFVNVVATPGRLFPQKKLRSSVEVKAGAALKTDVDQRAVKKRCR
jgi:hypothetical protein